MTPDSSPSAIPTPGWGTVLAWILRRVRRYRVHGRSMWPSLVPGDTVWVDVRAYGKMAPESGEIVVARHPFQTEQLLIKRVHSVLPSGSLELRGDAPDQSTDSRGLGAIAMDRVIGRVCARSRAATPSLD